MNLVHTNYEGFSLEFFDSRQMKSNNVNEENFVNWMSKEYVINVEWQPADVKYVEKMITISTQSTNDVSFIWCVSDVGSDTNWMNLDAELGEMISYENYHQIQGKWESRHIFLVNFFCHETFHWKSIRF